MSSSFDDLAKQARALPARDRAALLRVLIEELDPIKEPGAEELWLEEARRRYEAFQGGAVEVVPADKAIARARSRLR